MKISNTVCKVILNFDYFSTAKHVECLQALLQIKQTYQFPNLYKIDVLKIFIFLSTFPYLVFFFLV